MIVKLKRTPGLYLAGFMGCGKTTIGRRVADELGWHFADTDEDIEEQEHTTISEIFATRGEAAFRELETEAIRNRVRSVERGRPMVVAVGGGAFVSEVNYSLLEEHGVTIWLDCPFEIVCRRLEGSEDRPLARNQELFARLYEMRRAAYAKADYRIDAGREMEEVVQSILSLPIF
jgi:shikimate kinase